MHTIELSKKVRANQPLVIPAELLTQHIGAQAEIIVQFKLPHIPENVHEGGNWDAQWDELVERIKSTPTPPSQIKPATEPFTQAFADEFLAQDNNPDFDAKAWNAMWDEHEAEMKKLTRKKERAFLEDMASLFE